MIFDLRNEFFGDFDRDGEEQIFFVPEILIDCGVSYARILGNFSNGGVLEALFPEDFNGRV